jgi:hypothetical protein
MGVTEMIKSRPAKVGVLRDSHNLFFNTVWDFLMKFGAKKNPTVLAGGSRCAPNFIQKSHTVQC